MTCQAGCVKLQTKILEHWDPQTYNAGCFNPNSFYDGTRTPSDHARGEAFDVGIEVPYRGRQSTGQMIFLWLYLNRHALGLVQIIWYGQIWDNRNGHGESIRPYIANAHLDHIHVSMGPVAARDALLAIPPFPGAAPVPAPAPGPASGPHTNPTLKQGSHGPVVVVLQALLNNKLGRRLTTDGNFGPATDAAVRLFQANIREYFHLGRSFAVDGVVGPATWYWLSK